MRAIFRFSVLCLAAGVASGCKLEQVVPTEDVPTAAIRFVHAVPDTGLIDFRPVDIVENTNFYSVGFRSTTLLYYKAARAGSRHFRIFMSGTTSAVASIVVKDTTVTLEAGRKYTFLLWGFARTGSLPAMKLTVLDDNPADPGTQVGLRVINAASGLGALDVRQYPATGTSPGAATWGGVAELSASSYMATPVGSIKYNVQPAGGGTPLFADATALAGSPATVDLEATPGTTIAGSAVTGIVVPRSVAGSTAANFTTPGIIFVWDRRPPRTTP